MAFKLTGASWIHKALHADAQLQEASDRPQISTFTLYHACEPALPA